MECYLCALFGRKDYHPFTLFPSYGSRDILCHMEKKEFPYEKGYWIYPIRILCECVVYCRAIWEFIQKPYKTEQLADAPSKEEGKQKKTICLVYESCVLCAVCCAGCNEGYKWCYYGPFMHTICRLNRLYMPM